MDEWTVANWLTFAGLVVTIMLASIGLLTKFVRSEVDKSEQRGKAGDSELAAAIGLLNHTLETLAKRLEEGNEAVLKEIEDVRYELEHTNDGSTVKGALVAIQRRQLGHDADILRLNDRIDNLHPARHKEQS